MMGMECRCSNGCRPAALQKARIGFDGIEEGAVDVEDIYIVTFRAPKRNISHSVGNNRC